MVAIALFYTERHVEHHCHGEHCHVCHHIHRCLEFISVCMELVVEPFELALSGVFFRLPRVKFPKAQTTTLVSQKVLLLN